MSKAATPKKAATKRATSRAPQARDRLMSLMLSTPEGQSYMTAIAAAGMRLAPLDAVVPLGTFLDVVTRQVRDCTDMPPEIGLAATLSVIGAALSQNGCTVSWHDDKTPIHPALWLLVLAPSGAGKTLVRRTVADALGVKLRMLTDPGSGKAFLSALQAADGVAYWMRDEYGQLLKQIGNGGPLGQVRDYMLRAYDHDRIANETMKDGVVAVEKPILSILGVTVDATWSSAIDAEMLVDGLMARHLFMTCAHRPLSTPRYPIEQMMENVAAAAGPLRERLAQTGASYVIGRKAAALYETQWHELARLVGEKVDRAYFRRITWSAARYALIYHVLLEKEGYEIGTEAMSWAWRMVQFHMQATREVLSLADPGFVPKVLKIIQWIDEQIEAGTDLARQGGAALGRAVLTRFHRELGGANEAKSLVDLALKYAK
ncbi:MAG: DUF3987 domain-containing protein [Betaproteobacteria bacterium]|nr:DUF3987 domain-containing protein [Betaproteobacteria bacterium]